MSPFFPVSISFISILLFSLQTHSAVAVKPTFDDGDLDEDLDPFGIHPPLDLDSYVDTEGISKCYFLAKIFLDIEGFLKRVMRAKPCLDSCFRCNVYG